MATFSVMKGAEPWGADGDQVGVLFIHGYTGSPQSVRYWAEGVAAEGRTVLLPRLPGHGTDMRELQTTTAAEWVAEAEMSLRGLYERCHTIFVCALSFGGAIAVDLAARFGDRIDGLVLVNPSLYSTDPRRHLAPLVGRLPLFLKGVANDIADPTQRELAYAKVPTRASAEVLSYMARAKARLGSVRCPTLVFTSRQDHVVNPANGPFVLDTIGSTDKELVWLEKSYHVATLDYDRDLIVDRTNRFIAEHSERDE